ncbi:hypothetical protein KAH43_08440 [Candidatus Bipolaricaulota bacterium]|nr:hypothetical protein [Candidatus Bipolaricaulota bacterium]
MSKRALLTVMVVFAMVGTTLATPITDDILGAWVNIDPEADGLAQITILPSESGGLNVFGYGVCDPDFCDWGSTPLILVGMAPDYVNEWGIAIWDLDPNMMILTLHQEGAFLIVELFSYLTDGTGQPMREVALLRQAK